MTTPESNLCRKAAETVGLLIVVEARLDGKARDPHREQSERTRYVELAREARDVKRRLEKFLRYLGEA